MTNENGFLAHIYNTLITQPSLYTHTFLIQSSLLFQKRHKIFESHDQKFSPRFLLDHFLCHSSLGCCCCHGKLRRGQTGLAWFPSQHLSLPQPQLGQGLVGVRHMDRHHLRRSPRQSGGGPLAGCRVSRPNPARHPRPLVVSPGSEPQSEQDIRFFPIWFLQTRKLDVYLPSVQRLLWPIAFGFLGLEESHSS